LSKSGRDKGGYYHEFFLRSKPFLAHRISRTKLKNEGARKSTSPETEPNFYILPYLPVEVPRAKSNQSLVGTSVENEAIAKASAVLLRNSLLQESVVPSSLPSRSLVVDQMACLGPLGHSPSRYFSDLQPGPLSSLENPLLLSQQACQQAVSNQLASNIIPLQQLLGNDTAALVASMRLAQQNGPQANLTSTFATNLMSNNTASLMSNYAANLLSNPAVNLLSNNTATSALSSDVVLSIRLALAREYGQSLDELLERQRRS
jgi:hypothetical protein